MELKDLKPLAHQACKSILTEKLAALQTSLAQYQEAANNETKSSMGDKYETGRAMLMLEKEKLAGQMSVINSQLAHLSHIAPHAVHQEVKEGALIETNQGVYYASVSIGKLDLEGRSIFCLSMAAPMAKALSGKKEGDRVSFNGREVTIIQVL